MGVDGRAELQNAAAAVSALDRLCSAVHMPRSLCVVCVSVVPVGASSPAG